MYIILLIVTANFRLIVSQRVSVRWIQHVSTITTVTSKCFTRRGSDETTITTTPQAIGICCDHGSCLRIQLIKLPGYDSS